LGVDSRANWLRRKHGPPEFAEPELRVAGVVLAPHLPFRGGKTPEIPTSGEADAEASKSVPVYTAFGAVGMFQTVCQGARWQLIDL
jgi:hypothetical protein